MEVMVVELKRSSIIKITSNRRKEMNNSRNKKRKSLIL